MAQSCWRSDRSGVYPYLDVQKIPALDSRLDLHFATLRISRPESSCSPWQKYAAAAGSALAMATSASAGIIYEPVNLTVSINSIGGFHGPIPSLKSKSNDVFIRGVPDRSFYAFDVQVVQLRREGIIVSGGQEAKFFSVRLRLASAEGSAF